MKRRSFIFVVFVGTFLLFVLASITEAHSSSWSQARARAGAQSRSSSSSRAYGGTGFGGNSNLNFSMDGGRFVMAPRGDYVHPLNEKPYESGIHHWEGYAFSSSLLEGEKDANDLKDALSDAECKKGYGLKKTVMIEKRRYVREKNIPLAIESVFLAGKSPELFARMEREAEFLGLISLEVGKEDFSLFKTPFRVIGDILRDNGEIVLPQVIYYAMKVGREEFGGDLIWLAPGMDTKVVGGTAGVSPSASNLRDIWTGIAGTLAEMETSVEGIAVVNAAVFRKKNPDIISLRDQILVEIEEEIGMTYHEHAEYLPRYFQQQEDLTRIASSVTGGGSNVSIHSLQKILNELEQDIANEKARREKEEKDLLDMKENIALQERVDDYNEKKNSLEKQLKDVLAFQEKQRARKEAQQ